MSSDEVYRLLEQEFEWDPAKARRNWMRYRVLFTEAATVFFDPEASYYQDEEHSDDENRFVMIGHSAKARELLVVHVYRDERVRLISARTATPQERGEYEARLGR